MNTDPIADLLTRIRNINSIHGESVEIPFSKVKWAIVKLLKEEGFIRDCQQETTEKGFQNIKVWLKYANGKTKVISGLKRVSRPGLRIYSAADKAKKHRQGFGVTMLSTSKGVLTDRNAQKQKVGGEVLMSVW